MLYYIKQCSPRCCLWEAIKLGFKARRSGTRGHTPNFHATLSQTFGRKFRLASPMAWTPLMPQEVLTYLESHSMAKNNSVRGRYSNVPPQVRFPGGTSGKETACRCRTQKRQRFDPWVGKIRWRRAEQPTSVFLPGEPPWTEEPRSYNP